MHQFIRVESYARQPRKGVNIRDIAAEAEREPDHCRHVEQPKAPNILYGSTPTIAVDKAEAWADQFTDSIGRGLRKDGMCLLSGVISYPAHGEEWEGFKKDALAWLKEEYGENLECVLEHTDEAHPHIHFYAVPRQGQHFNTLHSGRAASEKVKKEGGTKGQQRLAFSEVMRKYQDSFHDRVSKKYALSRLGPERQRLTRAEWKLQLKANQVLAASAKAEYEISESNRAIFAEMLKELGKKSIVNDTRSYNESDLIYIAEEALKLGVLGQSQLQVDAVKAVKDSISSKESFELELDKLQQEITSVKNDFSDKSNKKDESIKAAMVNIKAASAALYNDLDNANAKISELETANRTLTDNNNSLADQNNDMIEQLREHGHRYS